MSVVTNLDKFYTKPSVAELCWNLFEECLLWPLIDYTFLEPSAGDGKFLRDGLSIRALDISPEHPSIEKQDFLEFTTAESYLVIGNPPFGKRGGLALQFLNKALSFSPLVGFIVPLQFRKWSIQKRVLPETRLILDETLPEDSFTNEGENYSLRTCFQVWADKEFPYRSGKTDLRRRKAPDISHPDFKLFQYNCTPEAEKYFSEDWDFAVLRQGFGDYREFKTRQEDCDRRKQWMLVRAESDEALDNLQSMDYAELAKKNTLIPGFGKADLVEEYKRLYDYF